MALAVPRFSTCQIRGCEKSSVRAWACSNCQKSLCSDHLSPPFHTCGQIEIDDVTWEKQLHNEVAALLAKVDVEALLKKVSSITGYSAGVIFEPGKYIGIGAVMGCANYHGWILFDDGKRWIVRIPRASYNSVPETLVEYLVASEYATLKFLENTKVPAPRAYAFELASDPENAVGVSYILMEALPGTPYNSSRATLQQKSRVLGQLADILIELSNFPVPRAGSLIQQIDGDIEVSSFASNRFIALHQYGPFNDALSYFVQTAEQHLDLIADQQLYYEYQPDAFKFYMILREHAHLLGSNEQPSNFFLKHVDDKGDHLLVDENGNITGIIDWQFARCVPPSESFGPSYITADLGALYLGKVETSAEDRQLAKELRKRGAGNIAPYMEQNAFARTFCHGLASGLRRDEVCKLIANVTAGLQANGLWHQDTMEHLERDVRWQRIKSCNNSVRYR